MTCDTSQSPESSEAAEIVILGGGLAGLTLARQLLLETDKRIVILDKRALLPGPRQKVGESSVQVGGYYFSKVLDLEAYLWREHFMKYNLRFYWKSAGRSNTGLEDYGQTFIRAFSNVPSYNLDRNRLEEHLLAITADDPRCEIVTGISQLNVELSNASRGATRRSSSTTDGETSGQQPKHRVTYECNGTEAGICADWVVDCTGRGRLLSRREQLGTGDPINHGSAFMWVDGLVDVEKLTRLGRTESRLNPDRRLTGHLPFWTATNHFMGEGFWLWVIPLGSGMTSLGVVFDNRTFDGQQVSTADALTKWICDEFPLFAADLPKRNVVDYSALRTFSYGCKQTISPNRWAMSGMSGRFTDPLYSPGSDFIGLHNMQIVDAIKTDDPDRLARKCRFFEMLSQSLHESLLPTYAISYDALGSQETFVLKYTWELSVYFAFFVFPFINDLEIDTDFIPAYLGRFSRLGKINHSVQKFISGYFQWKKLNVAPPSQPSFHDFLEMPGLQRAESTFYEVGVTNTQARDVLNRQLASLENMGRFIVAWICANVANSTAPLCNAEFSEAIDFATLEFDPECLRKMAACYSVGTELTWPVETAAMQKFAVVASSMTVPAETA